MLHLIAAVVLSFTCQPAVRNGWLCCSSPRAQAQQSLACPGSNYIPVISGGGNLFCSTPNQIGGQCGSNAICLLAQTSSSYICCLNNGASTTLTCPNNNQPLLGPGGLPQNCLPTQASACQAGYSCVMAMSSTQYICCPSTANPSCPAGLQPYMATPGQYFYCQVSQPTSCPSGSLCITDSNTQQSICCQQSTSQAICPNGLNAFLTPGNQPQQCSPTGASCATGYSCLYSTILNQYVCCGQGSNPGTLSATCADGRQTFLQTSGTTFTCNPSSFPTGCPAGYDCAQSTQPGTYVCCSPSLGTSTTIAPSFQQCPNGWNPYKNSVNQAVQYCSSTTDQSCPKGYSCTPSFQQSVYLCCRLASTPSCQTGTTYINNNLPRMCSVNAPNQCPRGYSCQQSTTSSITICCSTQFDSTVLCPDNSLPAMIGPNPRSCPILNLNAGCPAGYTCLTSNQGTNVCCVSSFSFSRTRLSPSTSSLVKCPNGVIPSLSQQSCSSNRDCPMDSSCIKTSGSSICCPVPVPSDTRCKARRTLLLQGQPVACLAGSSCPSDYECSYESSNSRAVCCESTQMAQELCPDNRSTFLIAKTEEPLFCDATAYTCPNGQECVQSKDAIRHVCCSPMAQCPAGTIRPSGKVYPSRCFTADGCPPEQSCVSSTVSDVRVCCNLVYHDEPKKTHTEEDWVVIEG